MTTLLKKQSVVRPNGTILDLETLEGCLFLVVPRDLGDLAVRGQGEQRALIGHADFHDRRLADLEVFEGVRRQIVLDYVLGVAWVDEERLVSLLGHRQV